MIVAKDLVYEHANAADGGRQGPRNVTGLFIADMPGTSRVEHAPDGISPQLRARQGFLRLRQATDLDLGSG